VAAEGLAKTPEPAELNRVAALPSCQVTNSAAGPARQVPVPPRVWAPCGL